MSEQVVRTPRVTSLNPGDKAPQTLYKMYNRYGALLYVGVSSQPRSRFDQHSKDKDWWPEVDIIKVEHYPTRVAVEIAEIHSIQSENPRYNKAFAIKGTPAPVGDVSETESLVIPQWASAIVNYILDCGFQERDLGASRDGLILSGALKESDTQSIPHLVKLGVLSVRTREFPEGVLEFVKLTPVAEEAASVAKFEADINEIESYVRLQGEVSGAKLNHRFRSLIKRSPRELSDRIDFLVESGRLVSDRGSGTTQYRING